jgi:hypothetical protein
MNRTAAIRVTRNLFADEQHGGIQLKASVNSGIWRELVRKQVVDSSVRARFRERETALPPHEGLAAFGCRSGFSMEENPAGRLRCHERLGGLLKFYQRAA